MYRLICQKPAHFLSAQIALVSTFFQMFIVLGMYNFVLFVKHTCDISMPFVKFSCIGKASVSVPATPGDVDEFTAGEEGRPAMRKKGASINNVINIFPTF